MLAIKPFESPAIRRELRVEVARKREERKYK